jgi:excisionase family DNA binding protein
VAERVPMFDELRANPGLAAGLPERARGKRRGPQEHASPPVQSDMPATSTKASANAVADPRHGGGLPHLLTLEEVANSLRLHPRTVRRMVDCGRIPCMRIGRAIRFAQGDVFAWLQARKEG